MSCQYLSDHQRSLQREVKTMNWNNENVIKFIEASKEKHKISSEEMNYNRNYNVTKDLTKSQYSVDYGPKQGDRKRFFKNNACIDNLYIYPPDTKLLCHPPNINAFGLSETKNAFVSPSPPSRLVTNKEQYKHPSFLHVEPPHKEPFHKGLEPLDTTHEGFEKFLDPYLTTSRLHHRPFTTEQLNRISNSKDVMTYYTYSELPWVRSPKPNMDIWRLPLSRHKSIYDREMFKDFREIRTHNQLNWTPGSFRTETTENYKDFRQRPESKIHNFEKDVQSYFQRATAVLIK